MKTILVILSILSFGISFSQKYDTVKYDVGKAGGFKRIRELNSKGAIRKVWITKWNEDREMTKSFSQYNSNNKKVTDVDSTFNENGRLIKFKRKIGDTIDGDEQQFSASGQLLRRDISLHINSKYIIFQKIKNDNGWDYVSIIDGNPPDYISINEERFEEAIKIYNDRLLLDKITN